MMSDRWPLATKLPEVEACPENSSMPALCVDLDGTLVRTDTLHEGVLRALRTAPLALLRALPLALQSRAAFKRRIAEIAPLDADTLPLNSDLLAYLDGQHALGRPIDLVSAADQSIVDAVASRIRLFDAAIGSDGRTNLSGESKLAAIRSRWGEHFVYAGDSRVDTPIWRAARAAIVVGSAGLARKVAHETALEATFPTTGRLRAAVKALRPHQWAKNLLIFVPFALAGPSAQIAEAFVVLLGFLAFGLLASAGYILNDLLDLDSDRAHPGKKSRPFASGALRPAEGGALGLAALAAAGAIMVVLGPMFAAVGLVYFAGTLSYSFFLKRIPLVDVVALSGLYTLRIVAGTALVEPVYSFWILTFSVFIFTALALIKRYAELSDERLGETVRTARGYRSEDLPLFVPFGIASSVSASLLFVVYLVEERFPSGVYTRPELLWFIFPLLLLWQMHMWRSALHGLIREDPVIFALKDPVSWGMGVAVGVIILLSW